MGSINISEFTCLRDGKTIRGKKYTSGKKNCPIMILSHGFMGKMADMAHYAERFADAGYICYIYDFCGGGCKSTSSGKTIEMTVFTEVEDLKSVIAHAKADGDTDEHQIVLMGESQGGFVSGIVAAELKNEIKKLVMYYPALCIPDDVRAGRIMLGRFNPQNIPDVINCFFIKVGKCYPSSIIDKDSYSLIKDYEGPVLLLHGTGDMLVKASYSQKAAKIYRNATLSFIEKAGHGFKKKQDEFAINCTKLFLQENVHEVLAIDVHVTGTKFKRIPGGMHVSLPFTGKATGTFFQGEILPGASDEQEHTKTAVKMCATYCIEGKDYTGEKCVIKIVNNNDGTGWNPTISTDSKVLDGWNNSKFYAVMEERKHGPIVHIFIANDLGTGSLANTVAK